MNIHPLTYIYLGLVIVAIHLFLIYRRNKKRQARQNEAQWLKEKAVADRADIQAARKKVRFLTIRELREAMVPGKTEDEYRMDSTRISVRSCILALRKMNLWPASKYANDPETTPQINACAQIEEVVVFPGTIRPYPEKIAGSEWLAFTVTSTGEAWIPLECDIYGNSLVAAVEADSIFKGDFPPEWEDRWRQGLKAVSVKTLCGTVEI